MKKKQLTYRFHNPNPEMVMEDYIQKIMIDNGVKDIFSALQDQEQKEGHTVTDFANAV